MELRESLVALAEQNHHGIAFLLAYGATWFACGVFWRVLDPNRAALATLFQGMIAFPVALAISLSIGAIGHDRPVDDAITELSVIIGASQLLGLPFLIYLHATKQFALVPIAFVSVCGMHFVLYSWLYQTWIYIAMSITIALGGTILMMVNRGAGGEATRASHVCFFTGLVMYLTSGALALQ